MKLKNYFIEQKDQSLNTSDKFFLYEKIIAKKEKKQFFNIYNFFNIKSFAYGFAVILLFVGIYGVYFFNGDLSYEGFLVKSNINQVSADYIAKVIDFNGNFYIKHEGKYYKTSNISNGDNVILKKGSEVVFNTNSDTKTTIQGPAKFTLNKNGDNYQLLLSEGNFVQMESTKDQKGMELVVSDITIAANKNMKFQLTKEKDQYKINNQGSSLTITKKDDIQQLDNKQLLTINDNQINIIKNIEDFESAITTKNVSQKFTLNNTQEPTKQEINEKLIQTIDQNDAQITNIELAKDLGIIDDKIIPTEQQTKELHSILNNNFVMGNIEDMYISKVSSKQDNYTYNQQLLESRIQKIYKLFDLKYKKQELKSNIKELQNLLSTNYHIPDRYIYNLSIINNWVDYINKLEQSGLEDNQANGNWKSLETNLPSYLVLK